MSSIKLGAKGIFCGLLLCAGMNAHALDSFSIEGGAGENVAMARLGLQWEWEKPLLQFNGFHLGGYWEASIAQWRGTRHRNKKGNQYITSFGFTPTFRLQADDKKGLYLEGAIGVNWLTDKYDNGGKKLSTKFQFGDFVGIGYTFSNGMDLSLRYEHYSNGGIKKPNSGVDFGVVRFRMPLDF